MAVRKRIKVGYRELGMRECFSYEWRNCKEQSDLESPLNKLNVFNTEPMCIKGPLCEHGFRESCGPKERTFRPYESHCLLMLEWRAILVYLEWGAWNIGLPAPNEIIQHDPSIVFQRFLGWRLLSQVAALLEGSGDVGRWDLLRGSRSLRKCVIGNMHWKNITGPQPLLLPLLSGCYARIAWSTDQ